MVNMEIWEKLFKTDPKFTKPITGKTYSGTSPDPYYVVKRMTETFGPCGIGWGVDVVSQQIHEIKEDKAAIHFCLVNLWYMNGDKKASVQAFGGTQLSYVSNKGKLIFDEDAPKKSMTDAMVKAASYIGMCGDIFAGLYDDSKYVNGLKDEFRGKNPENKLTQIQQKALSAIVGALNSGNAKLAQNHAAALSDGDWNAVWAEMPESAQKSYSQSLEQA